MCAAENAGFVECTGLPERVKTGCMATPEQTSLFCMQHNPRQMKLQSSDSSVQEVHHGVVEIILRKEDTRTTTHYEVCAYYTIKVENNACSVRMLKGIIIIISPF